DAGPGELPEVGEPDAREDAGAREAAVREDEGAGADQRRLVGAEPGELQREVRLDRGGEGPPPLRVEPATAARLREPQQAPPPPGGGGGAGTGRHGGERARPGPPRGRSPGAGRAVPGGRAAPPPGPAPRARPRAPRARRSPRHRPAPSPRGRAVLRRSCRR